VALRAVFAGIGQLLMAVDKIRAQMQEQATSSAPPSQQRPGADQPPGQVDGTGTVTALRERATPATKPPAGPAGTKPGTATKPPAATKPGAATKPPAATKPAAKAAAGTEPGTAAKAAARTKPGSGARAAAATKPAAEAAAGTGPGTGAAKQAGAKPGAATVKPAAGAKPGAGAAKLAAGTKPPASAKPAAPPAASTPAAAKPAPPADAAQPAPIPGYDDLSIASLRARLRGLDAAGVQALLDYEKANAHRDDVITMFERRLSKIENGTG
jgi:hypothetical protein